MWQENCVIMGIICLGVRWLENICLFAWYNHVCNIWAIFMTKTSLQSIKHSGGNMARVWVYRWLLSLSRDRARTKRKKIWSTKALHRQLTEKFSNIFPTKNWGKRRHSRRTGSSRSTSSAIVWLLCLIIYWGFFKSESPIYASSLETVCFSFFPHIQLFDA